MSCFGKSDDERQIGGLTDVARLRKEDRERSEEYISTRFRVNTAAGELSDR